MAERAVTVTVKAKSALEATILAELKAGRRGECYVQLGDFEPAGRDDNGDMFWEAEGVLTDERV